MYYISNSAIRYSIRFNISASASVSVSVSVSVSFNILHKIMKMINAFDEQHRHASALIQCEYLFSSATPNAEEVER